MRVNSLSHNNGFNGHLEKLGYLKPKRDEFCKYLWESGAGSVDAYLEVVQNFAPIGKACIAIELMSRESHGGLIGTTRGDGNRSWYEYLWKKIAAPLDKIIDNSLSIVTFNYDRSLEHYLFTCIKSMKVGMSDQEASEIFRQAFKIVHVHGQLGRHPCQQGESRPYEPDLSDQLLKVAINQIVVLHEAKDTSKEFKEATSIISKSKTVCILGLGYHPKNIERLHLDTINWAGKTIYACLTGLEFQDRQQAIALFKSLPLTFGPSTSPATHGRFFSGEFEADALLYLQRNVPLS